MAFNFLSKITELSGLLGNAGCVIIISSPTLATILWTAYTLCIGGSVSMRVYGGGGEGNIVKAYSN